MMKFSRRCFLRGHGHCFMKSNGLLVLRAHHIAEHRDFSWVFFVKTKSSRGCFIQYHCVRKSDWLFFLMAISSECISWKFKMKVPRECFLWGHNVQKSDRDLFSGSPLDSRIPRSLWKHFIKNLTQHHPNQPWHCNS